MERRRRAFAPLLETPMSVVPYTPKRRALSGAIVLLGMMSTSNAQQRFNTPGEAVNAFVGAVRLGEGSRILALLGRQAADIVSSGDKVADAAQRQRFVTAYDAKHRIEVDGEKKATLIVGEEDFPFPIPIVQKNNAWHFDAAAGRQEILYRRIGRNELDTIQTCLAYVDAQNEYAEKDRTGAGPGVYAQRIISQPGKKDGLYWQSAEGEDPSPLGDLFAEASQEGYRIGAERTPFHGYYFKILTKQGPNAPGGALDYLVNGKMIGGFALVAFPAMYANTGVMTFLVNHTGQVYQKDLGVSGGRLALFNPDQTWQKVDASP
jgi:hypothetical protein